MNLVFFTLVACFGGIANSETNPVGKGEKSILSESLEIARQNEEAELAAFQKQISKTEEEDEEILKKTFQQQENKDSDLRHVVAQLQFQMAELKRENMDMKKQNDEKDKRQNSNMRRELEKFQQKTEKHFKTLQTKFVKTAQRKNLQTQLRQSDMETVKTIKTALGHKNASLGGLIEWIDSTDTKLNNLTKRVTRLEKFHADRHLVNRFKSVDSTWGYGGTDAIQFKVNRRIVVVGLGLYGCATGSSTYSVDMKIFETSSSSGVSPTSTSFTCDGTETPFQVMFDEPAVIKPDTVYTITCLIHGVNSYASEKGQGQSTVVVNIANQGPYVFTYSTSPLTSNGDTVNRGTIPVIVFQT